MIPNGTFTNTISVILTIHFQRSSHATCETPFVYLLPEDIVFPRQTWKKLPNFKENTSMLPGKGYEGNTKHYHKSWKHNLTRLWRHWSSPGRFLQIRCLEKSSSKLPVRTMNARRQGQAVGTDTEINGRRIDQTNRPEKPTKVGSKA